MLLFLVYSVIHFENCFVILCTSTYDIFFLLTFYSAKEPKKEREITTPKFPFVEDTFSEFPELKEEYDLAPDFQRINISGEDTSGV